MHDEIGTPLGPLQLRFDDAGLHAVTIMRAAADMAGTDAGRRGRYAQRDAFERYFKGDLNALTGLRIVMNGTAFQQRVWQALRRIPPGTTWSYAQLAKKIGNGKATRAVGAANGRNPLCIVVPCHRVISSDGSLGGFSAGLDAKRWLLRHEGAEHRGKA